MRGDFSSIHMHVCGSVIAQICGWIDQTGLSDRGSFFDNGLLRGEPLVSNLISWSGFVVGTNIMEICAQGTVEFQATTISEKWNLSIEAVFSTEHLMLCR